MSGEHPHFLWRNPEPKSSYEVVVVRAAGHGLATKDALKLLVRPSFADDLSAWLRDAGAR